ncbi:hypothetical protein F0562_023144 [Nyssa sinensis]|uniref:Uncharacterized protein n=1 Tax=Nyssa sinensis TaxID=561372 RepID=A0A5J5BJV3_9ASTE|nr:hypothetical protein F0562_023144 [Nyssa sinensis]
MEYTLLDTSLDLNANPLRFLDEAPNKEMESNFIGLGRKSTTENALVEELNRVKAENKKLTQMLTVLV